MSTLAVVVATTTAWSICEAQAVSGQSSVLLTVLLASVCQKRVAQISVRSSKHRRKFSTRAAAVQLVLVHNMGSITTTLLQERQLTCPSQI